MPTATVENSSSTGVRLADLAPAKVADGKVLAEDLLGTGKRKTQRAIRKGYEAGEDCLDDTTHYIKHHPWQSVGIAVGVGTLALSLVLCVDDDEDTCEMLSLLLNSHRIEATCVKSAAEAWPLITSKRFDLYLLDSWLPGIDGFALCRQIRESDSETPILFYSGAAYDSDKQKALAAGANGYLTKPDIEGLIETISNLISRARAGAAASHGVGSRLPSVNNSLSA